VPLKARSHIPIKAILSVTAQILARGVRINRHMTDDLASLRTRAMAMTYGTSSERLLDRP
jgi:hypothetical protein